MHIQLHPYAFFLLASALISGVVAVLAQMRRQSPGMGPLSVLARLMMAWALFAALFWMSASLEAAHFWFYVMYFAVVGAPLALLILILEITHQEAWLTKGRLALLLAEPVLLLIAVWTNDFHHLFVTRFSSHIEGGLLYMEIQRGPLYWFNVVYSYAILFACMVLLARSFARTAPLYRRQLVAFMLGASLPWLGNVAMLAGLIPFRNLDVTSFMFGFTTLIYYFTLASELRFKLLPVARSLLLQTLSDGLLVVDAHFVFLDINPAAERLLGVEARDIVGRSGAEVFPEWADLLPILRERGEEISMEVQGRIDNSRHMDLKITPVRNNSTVTGYLILFRDITDRWQVEQQIRQANLELQARFNEIEALQQELRAQATRDPLTNLYNRRYLEETLENELARAEREGNLVSIIMLDADRFKRINDQHGHKAGDMALQGLARIIQTHIRKSDIACRYGGEEFVIVMPNTEMEVARERAEKIREDFRKLDFIGPGTQAETSLSIGIAAYPLAGRRGEEVLDAADQAMYAAKVEGGNRIKIQIEPVKKPPAEGGSLFASTKPARKARPE